MPLVQPAHPPESSQVRTMQAEAGGEDFGWYKERERKRREETGDPREPTEEELEACIAEQRRNLPDWWKDGP